MSLYYDASFILTASTQQGSLKSRIYAKDTNLKSKPAHIYALISEAAKYDVFLKEVIDNAGVLDHEPKLTPVLALLLIHDHLFAKGGIAASTSHPLRQAVERHKARLQSEFTKARLKRRVPTVEQLKVAILKEKGVNSKAHPRWARVNTLKAPLEDTIERYFSGYTAVDSVEKVVVSPKNAKILHHDLHIPNLLAFPPDADLTKHQAYLKGEIILQDKASCFPAHLLMGSGKDEPQFGGGIDGCAAPGNKTTHMAALVSKNSPQVYACERDPIRSKTLRMMIEKASAERAVTVLSRQDFLALDPADERFRNVTHLLLDPSCSGSGILGREDIPKLSLPEPSRKVNATTNQQSSTTKKRKRDDKPASPRLEINNDNEDPTPTASSDPDIEQTPIEATKARLEKLSNLQSRIVEHAFTFPSARRVTYSTCSVHVEENEAVVARVLASTSGKTHAWRVLRREEQVLGLRSWNGRGVHGGHGLNEEQTEACIRCTPDDGEGTMGFFVCGFVRDGKNGDTQDPVESIGDDDWEGFSDS